MSVGKLVAVIFAFIGVIAVLFVLCSDSRRERVWEEISALVGAEEGAPEKKEPKVIREAKAREAWRQSNTWTIENIHDEPALFLKEKLDDLNRLQDKLEKSVLSLNTKFAEMRIQSEKYRKREIGADAFIRKGLAAYEVAEKTGEWPAYVNGHRLEKTRLQTLICQASRRRDLAGKQIKRLDAFQTRLKTAVSKIQNETLPRWTRRAKGPRCCWKR